MTYDANSIVTVLIVQSARAAVLILAILLLRFVLGKRIPPAWRHAIWGLVPLQLLLVVSIPSSISLLNLWGTTGDGGLGIGVGVESSQVETVALPIGAATVMERSNPAETLVEADNAASESTLTEADLAVIAEALAQMNLPASDNAAVPTLPQPEPPVLADLPLVEATLVTLVETNVATNNVSRKAVWPVVALTVWDIGCLVMIVIFVRQIVRCRCWIARGKPVTSEPVLQLFEESCRQMKIKTWLVVAESSVVRGPFLIGAIRPKLLLPCQMVESASQTQLHAVFLHELAHLKRWDIWTGWLMTLLLIVHWFNPLLWLAIRRMNADREEACDVMAMGTLDRMQQGDYAHSLLDIAQHFVGPTHAPGLVGISETGKFLARRIDMLKQMGTWKLRWKILAFGLVLLIAAVTLTDAQDKKEAKPKPDNIVVDGVEYAPVVKEETKARFGEDPKQLVSGKYENDDNTHVELIHIMPGVYKINMTRLSKFDYEGVATRDGDTLQCEFMSYDEIVTENVPEVGNVFELVQKPVPGAIQTVTIDIRKDENGKTALAFPQTDEWDAFEVSLTEKAFSSRDLNGGFRGTIDGKTIAIDLIPVRSRSMIPPDSEYVVNIYSANFRDHNAGGARLQGSERKSLRIQLTGDNINEFGLEKQSFDMGIEKDENGVLCLKMLDDPAPENFPVLLTKITSNSEWDEINEIWEKEKNNADHLQVSDNEQKLPEIVGIFEGAADEWRVVLEISQPIKPNSKFPLFLRMEKNLAGASERLFYEGKASFVQNNELAISFTKNLPSGTMPPGAVPESMMNLTATLGEMGTPIEPGSRMFVPTFTLTIPKTELWEELCLTKSWRGAEIAELKQQLLEKEYSIANLQIQLAENNRVSALRVPSMGEAVGGFRPPSPNPPTPVVEPKLSVIYELPPSADPDSFVKMAKALLEDEPDAELETSYNNKEILIFCRDSGHQKIEMLSRVFKVPEPEIAPERRMMVYRLLNADAEKTAATLHDLTPNTIISAESETNSLLISALPQEIVVIRKLIEMIDQQSASSDKIIYCGMNFNYISAEEAQKALKIYRPDLESRIMEKHNGLSVDIAVSEQQEIADFLKALDQTAKDSGRPIHPSASVGVGKAFIRISAEEARKALKKYRPDLESRVYPENNSLGVGVAASEQQEIADFLEALDQPTKSPDELSVTVYRLSSLPSQTVMSTLQGMLENQPNVKALFSEDIKFTADERTNSIIVLGRKADHEKAKEVIDVLDKTRDSIPATVYQQQPQPADPVAGKYLATSENGEQIGIELSRNSQQTLLGANYRIVMYVGGFSGDGYKEDKGRMIGTASLTDNQLMITWEIIHDGKRYQIPKETQTSCRIVHDNDNIILAFDGVQFNNEKMDSVIAEKVKEK